MTVFNKVTAFAKRWLVWITIGLGILAGLRKIHAAERARDAAEKKLRDRIDDDIGNEWDNVDARVAEFEAAQQRAEKAAGVLNDPLNKIADSSSSAGDTISRWNNANRVRDD